MKRSNVLFGTTAILLLILLPLFTNGCYLSDSQSNSDNTVQQSYNLDELNNYGEWVHINTYGNVWRPYVVDNWMPFENGHWTFANGDWTWVSYEPFGWIVYHYGYWYDDPSYGWVWYPSDDSWSPARVMWVDYDDYVGWAPLPPRGLAYGKPWEANEDRHWHVVRQEDFTKDNIRNFNVTNPVRNASEIKRVANNQPTRNEIEQHLGKTVPEVSIQNQKVKLPQREIQRINLPQQENKRVEENSQRVKKEVILPREEFQKKPSEKNRKK